VLCHLAAARDFMIPYGVLARSGAAEVLAVSTQAGPLHMRPALTIEAQATIAQFDERFPAGADYVIVPAVTQPNDAALVQWIATQGALGATVVSICDGALVVANAGLFRGRRATAHWATASYRQQHYPDTQWQSNIRYVADAKVVSSAGVSAAMPTALALVEAIAGHDRAAALAQDIGIDDWSPVHNSDIFKPRLGVNLGAYITGYTNQWFHGDLAIDTLIAPGGCKGQEFYAPPALVAWIAQQATRVRRLCSVCTGAFLLAAAGQLRGKRAATHWEWVERLQTLHPDVNIDADKLFIRDGAVWTSAGVSAGIDLTLALIEEDYGHRIAIETARQLVMFIKRSGGQSQFSVPLAAQARQGGRFDSLHAWVADHLHDNLTVDRLAEQAGMTPRTFARSYVAQMGRTPARMVEAMRLEAACRALEHTTLPLKAIAASSGYVEEQNLRRVFQRQLGVNPGQYRSRFSGHGTEPGTISPGSASAPARRRHRGT